VKTSAFLLKNISMPVFLWKDKGLCKSWLLFGQELLLWISEVNSGNTVSK